MPREFCQKCGKNPSYEQIRVIENGVAKELSLCMVCAYPEKKMTTSPIEGARVLVTGGTGFLGNYVMEILRERGATPISVSKSQGYDLRSEAETLQAFLAIQPDFVVHLAALCGGIGANMASPGRFFRENMQMGMNVVHATAVAGKKLVAVGSVCSYPKNTKSPFKEEDYWNGYPEETNAPYGIAKKALGVMMEGYRKEFGLRYAYLIPANLYGPLDHFDAEKSHVIPAMIRKFVEAKVKGAPEVVCWGTGKPTRSFLFAADAAEAIVRATYALDTDQIVNLPGKEEISMAALARMISDIVDYKGKIRWNAEAPDGQPKRFIDGTRAKEKLGWEPTTDLEAGLRVTVEWYLSQLGPRGPEGVSGPQAVAAKA